MVYIAYAVQWTTTTATTTNPSAGRMACTPLRYTEPANQPESGAISPPPSCLSPFVTGRMCVCDQCESHFLINFFVVWTGPVNVTALAAFLPHISCKFVWRTFRFQMRVPS